MNVISALVAVNNTIVGITTNKDDVTTAVCTEHMSFTQKYNGTTLTLPNTTVAIANGNGACDNTT